MLPLSWSQTPMQGSFVRGAPSWLTSSLYSSVSRRITWAGIARCADGSSVPSQSINPNSPASQQSNTTVQHPDPNALPPTLAPLPSASRNETFRVERTDRSSSFQNGRFRSVGSRSEPSLSSIPGKFSKYSKPIGKLHTASFQKRAERRDKKAFRKPMGDVAAQPDWNVVSPDESTSFDSAAATAKKKNASSIPPPVDKLPEWMQQYQFSYSEIPSAPIIGFRETPWSPFGPEDMVARPWTGCAPLKQSKKKRPEFDSFDPPPAGKKGVKYVQKPGPFPPGEGPKPGKTREEILGAPLTPLEIQELVTSVNKGNKQLNLGRDGLTHNMLDVIHSHWKRSVCCKIKCKGVPTIDLDNVARVIEEKTGGVIIHRAGGVMFVFRGRNYNYKDKPKIPIMLWKPPDPIYPRLIQPIPEGLTEQEAKDLRAKGRRVAPLCKLAKNGVYMTLVADVKAQFEIDEVVRVDCQGMNPTDYKKIGAKLKDLVPCTLLSFEKEQIIMCRKKKPIQDENDELNLGEDKKGLDVSVDSSNSTDSTGLLVTEQYAPAIDELEQKLVLAEDGKAVTGHNPYIAIPVIDGNTETSGMNGNLDVATSVMDGHPEDESSALDGNHGRAAAVIDMNTMHAAAVVDRDTKHVASVTDVLTKDALTDGYMEDVSSVIKVISKDPTSVTDGNISVATSLVDLNTEDPVTSGVTEGSEDAVDDVDLLWQKAIDEGKALQLDSQIADPDIILGKAALLSDVLEANESEERAAIERLEKERIAEQNKLTEQVPLTSPFDVPSMGGLGVDELAKLLAP